MQSSLCEQEGHTSWHFPISGMCLCDYFYFQALKPKKTPFLLPYAYVLKWTLTEIAKNDCLKLHTAC